MVLGDLWLVPWLVYSGGRQRWADKALDGVTSMTSSGPWRRVGKSVINSTNTIFERLAQKTHAKMSTKMQKYAKFSKNAQKHNKIEQKIACKTEKLAQLEKICTDGVTSVTIYFHL